MITTEQQKQVISINGKSYVLKFNQYNDEIDLDQIVTIDYSNIMGELLTFQVVENKIGLLLAEATEQLSEANLDLDILEARLKEEYRNRFAEKGLKYTVDAIKDSVVVDQRFVDAKKKVIKLQKGVDYIDRTYWSCKGKSNKLNGISSKLTPEELKSSLVAGAINGVMVKLAASELQSNPIK